MLFPFQDCLWNTNWILHKAGRRNLLKAAQNKQGYHTDQFHHQIEHLANQCYQDCLLVLSLPRYFLFKFEFRLLVLGLYFADQLPVKEGHKIVCSDLDRYTFQILHQ